ncbi:hypothetical protein [Novosphingobium sp. HII-3]|uniref:hypothetical protein n=1 Tax=Novosphingobium sp. HII-3 TaxID=2075565 RepID=UPI000CDB1226|nr:hypothetical protein [Novosphingobium sp. HII-3]
MGEIQTGEPAQPDSNVRADWVHDGYVAIIRRQIAENNIRLRELQRLGIITERTRRSFDERLSGGRISIGELWRIYNHLKIDMIRAMVAVMILRKPMAYFEPFCETLAAYTEELSIAMHEQISATAGDFQPIRRNLVQAHTSKLTRQVFEHQQRTMQLSEQAFQ